jgi:hypothetical protein
MGEQIYSKYHKGLKADLIFEICNGTKPHEHKMIKFVSMKGTKEATHRKLENTLNEKKKIF